MLSKEELIGVYDETLNCINKNKYKSLSGKEIALPTKTLINGSRFYRKVMPAKPERLKTFKNPKIYVENIDTLEKAKTMGQRVAVLNMASFSNPGGGVARGSRAQEEELCRRTNLLLSLYLFHEDLYSEVGYESCDEKYHYPIPALGGIYTPDVTVFRDKDDYEYLNNPFKIAVISVPGVKYPTVDPGTGLMSDKDAKFAKLKIMSILRIAQVHNKTKLVLGALGCGAFKCPPKHMALLFKEVLEMPEFKNHFEEICFAILDDHNSPSGGNYQPFKEVFS